MSEALEQLLAADAALNAEAALPLPVTGLEAVVIGTVSALSSTDWWLPGLRERAGAVLRGAPVARLRDPSDGVRPYRVAPVTGSAADRALYAVGLGAAHPDQAAVVHLGIGSMADGAAHEALNLAGLLSARVVFVVAAHPLDGDAPLGPQLAGSLGALASAHRLSHHRANGMDADAVRQTVRAALDAGGPHLIEATLERTS